MSSIFLPRPPKISDDKWEEYIKDQEILLIALEIREELIDEALKQGAVTSRQNDVAQFVVTCAAESWKKIIYLNFLYYDKYENIENAIFGKTIT